MKKKKILLDESHLMSKTEEAQVRGGKRYRWKAADGSKLKVILKE